MKKISLFLAAAAAVLGFTSCTEDKEPVYTVPTEFILNTPAMADQYIELSDAGTIELVASQPDYGYSAVANYSAEVSLSEDFLEYEALEPVDNHQARMTFSQDKLALAMCNLLGVEGEDSFNEMYPDGMPYMTVYFRAVCQLEGVESSLIKSNVVSYNNIKGYLAVQTPGYIYLVGNPEGWSGPDASNAAHYAPWRLFEPENAIGSHVYVGVFDLPSAPMFRFYTALTGWDADSYGCQVDDNPMDFEMVDGSFTAPLVKGKGSFNFPNFMGGTVTITVDMSDPNNMTWSMVEGEHEVIVPNYVYMVGNNAGWAEPSEANAATYEPWRLVDASNSGVYAGTFDFTDFTADGGVLYCRFYGDLPGWGPAGWSSSTNGSDNIECASGVAMPTFQGEGCFTFAAQGHKVQVVLDTNQDQVTFTYAD